LRRNRRRKGTRDGTRASAPPFSEAIRISFVTQIARVRHRPERVWCRPVSGVRLRVQTGVAQEGQRWTVYHAVAVDLPCSIMWRGRGWEVAQPLWRGDGAGADKSKTDPLCGMDRMRLKCMRRFAQPNVPAVSITDRFRHSSWYSVSRCLGRVFDAGAARPQRVGWRHP